MGKKGEQWLLELVSCWFYLEQVQVAGWESERLARLPDQLPNHCSQPAGRASGAADSLAPMTGSNNSACLLAARSLKRALSLSISFLVNAAIFPLFLLHLDTQHTIHLAGFPAPRQINFAQELTKSHAQQINLRCAPISPILYIHLFWWSQNSAGVHNCYVKGFGLQCLLSVARLR